MSVTIQCPACESAVSLPDQLVGKKVKCPQCEGTFVATPPASAPADAPVEVGAAVEGPLAAAELEEAVIDSSADEPARRRRRRREDDDDSDRRPARRPRRSQGMSVESKVLGPAIGLMVVGAGGMLITLGVLVLNIIGIASLASAPRGTRVDEGALVGVIVRAVLSTIATLAMSGVVLSGGLRMKSRTGYSYAIAASVVAMLPCQFCCLVGIPIGVWSLIVLMQEDVKRDFE